MTSMVVRLDPPRRRKELACRGAVALIGLLAPLTLAAEIERPAIVVGAPTHRGTSRCRQTPVAGTTEYLVGLACPPLGFDRVFGYEPALVETPNGWRYIKPVWADGHCSGPIGNTGPFWDFELACQTHDYGYDLIRLGVGNRGDTDALLYADMMMICEHRGALDGVGCRTVAASSRFVLRVGEMADAGPVPGSMAEGRSITTLS